MRRLVPFALIALAACGGGDSADTADAVDTPVTGSSVTNADEPTSEAPPVSIQRSPLLPADECVDEPDPANYPEAEIPPAAWPCTAPEALVSHLIREGTGRMAQDGDTMIVDYIGMRVDDGAIFDESYSRGVPIDFPLGRGGVIRGWDDGLIGTQAGTLVRLDIPAELAYGDSPPAGDSGIAAGDDLSFVIEVRAVVPPVTAADAPLDLDVEPSVGATEVGVTEVRAGDGAEVEVGDTAVVHILLVRGDNEVVLFDTWQREDPLQIIMEEGNTLPGLFEGLQGANVGDLLVLTVPPADAFGEQGDASLGLPANTDLIVVADVVGKY